jgi:N-acetylgalactosamine-6-sulfatase
MKPIRLILTALLLAPLAALHANDASKQSARPNIVFIFADDWGWGDLSCHGHPWLKTPNLDRLAAEGTDFQQFNVLNPVCSPSRAAVMTGLYPARFCIHQHFASPQQNAQRNMPDWLDPKAVMLPRLLKQAGYRTAHFGKWHLTNRETHGAPPPAAYGYDEAHVFNGGAELPSADLLAAGEDAAAFIKASASGPFFINVWLHESHTPHVPTKASMEKWKHLEQQQQVYAAVITDGDNAVGRILAALKESGVDDNTLVMFSSDNGPEWTGKVKKPAVIDKHTGAKGYDTYYSVGETSGLRGRKRSLFEGGVRVPFLVRWPGKTPAGVKNDRTVFTAVDLLPTLCAAASVALPSDYRRDGENLLPALLGEVQTRTRPIFWQWNGNASEPDWWPRLAVREGDWKLVMTYDAKRVELHHLNDDRSEAKDVSQDHPEIVARLSKLALEWQETLPEKPNPACISEADRTAAAKAAPAVNSARPKVTAEQRAKAFQRWDTNEDGLLTLDEYKSGLKGQKNLETRFNNFDKNSDGKLTREEFVKPDSP